MFKLKYFTVQELVPKEVFLARGVKAIELMDKELLVFIDKLREVLGKPITINTWNAGGVFSYRGLRTIECPQYSAYSQHTYGKALDFDVAGMSAHEVREWIIANKNLDWVKPISFIEDNVNWVHVDTRPSVDGTLVLWDPKTNKVKTY